MGTMTIDEIGTPMKPNHCYLVISRPFGYLDFDRKLNLVYLSSRANNLDSNK